MALDPSLAGRSYPPTRPYEVGREKIREFAAAIGDPHPALVDPEAAAELGYKDVVAPPTLAVIAAFQGQDVVVSDPDVGIDYSRVVHGSQRFVHSRPMQPGDRVVTTATIETARTVSGSDILTVRTDIDTVDGEHLCTAYSTLVARGDE